MRRLVAVLGLGLLASAASAQQAPAPRPAASADPYAGAVQAGQLRFPLAAEAGKDSGAVRAAPAGAVNTGPFDPAKWRYGPGL